VWSVRIGLVAYGFVHLLIALVALRLAFGQRHRRHRDRLLRCLHARAVAHLDTGSITS
jgi:hypothetical protein